MDEDQARGLWAPQRRALTAGLVLTITFVASEALSVVTVMPIVARDLGGLRLYGWVFSGFMLGSVIGIVAAGREADRRGPAVPFVAGVLLFGCGLAVAGLAPSMGVLVAGRVLQGVGAGAVPSVSYATIGRTLSGPLRARMMAVLSTAWVVPGLAGPAISAEVAHRASRAACHDSRPGPADVHVLRRRRLRDPGGHVGASPQPGGGQHRRHRCHPGLDGRRLGAGPAER
jgi:MFS family permease